jgi:hypothetical protein
MAGSAGQSVSAWLRRALVSLWLASAAAAHASPALPSLKQRLAQARLVVSGDVAGVTLYDSGRISVARVSVSRVLKGDAGGTQVMVVERHDLPSSPELLQTGEHAVVLLVPAARTSSLKATLPEGTYYALVDGRAGVLASRSAADVQEAAGIIARLLAPAATPVPDAERRAASRQLVFDEIAARHPLVVADGVGGLAAIPDLAMTLSPQERQRLEAALRRTDLPNWVRVALVNAAADRGLTALVPALRGLPDPTPELQRAAWDALTRLGAAPSADDLKPSLASGDPAIRSAAAHALLAAHGTDAIADVAKLALDDPDHSVRLAAIDALGESKLPEALPSLEQAFANPENALRQGAGRAIYTIGGRPAAECFARLAFEGPPDAQKYALILLLVSGVPRDDPLVERIRTTHPDESIRRIATEGLDVHEH